VASQASEARLRSTRTQALLSPTSSKNRVWASIVVVLVGAELNGQMEHQTAWRHYGS
jgi:hypothetical protein